MSNKRRNLDNNNSSMSNKRRKLNPDNENYNSIITLSNNNNRRKIDKNKVREMKKRQANYIINSNSKEYDNSNKEYDNYIEINHCKEAIQMAVDIALKKKEAQTGGKTQKKRTNKNKRTNKRKTNKK